MHLFFYVLRLLLCAVLCTTIVHNDMHKHTHEQFIHFCMLGLDFFLCVVHLGFVFCVFFMLA